MSRSTMSPKPLLMKSSLVHLPSYTMFHNKLHTVYKLVDLFHSCTCIEEKNFSNVVWSRDSFSLPSHCHPTHIEEGCHLLQLFHLAIHLSLYTCKNWPHTSFGAGKNWPHNSPLVLVKTGHTTLLWCW